MHELTILFAVLAATTAACSDPADGTLRATVYGEEFIEEGIPADVFVDGWAVRFDRFLVSVGDVAGQAGEGSAEIGDPAFRIVDLAQASGGEGHLLTTLAAPGGDYDHYGYQLRSDQAATSVNAEPADVAAMKAAGASVWVRGSAARGAETRTFDWSFTLALTYGHCDLGLTVDGNTVTAQATIHADHLFYDDAVATEPDVAFQLIADADGLAGAPADGAITLEELAAVDIRQQGRYQVGSLRDPAGQPIVNLRQFVEHMVVTLGHINGEGHCDDQRVTP